MMILADKIINLRKKCGWSQEELAEKLGVSRQSVSKWESAQSTPDIDKILIMSQLFGVSTDYLLKEEIEAEENVEDTAPALSLDKVNEFIALRLKAAKRIAIATFMCIFSPIPLIFLAGMANEGMLKESVATAIGLVLLLAIVAFAVAIFISTGIENSKYEFLDKEKFNLERSALLTVRDQRDSYRPTYTKYNMLGTSICILAAIPVLIGAFIGIDMLVITMLCITILTAGVGAVLFIRAGVVWSAYQKLSGEGEYSEDKKKYEALDSAYWLIATAIYLAWSFATNDWGRTWIIWPVAAVLYGALAPILKTYLGGKKNDDKDTSK